MSRYYFSIFFTCLLRLSIAQDWGNPYQEKLTYFVGQPYETAISALKEGKTVKSLIIASYMKGFGQPLEQFKDIEQVSLELSRVDSTQLEITFQQLSRLPKLHYLSISSFSGQDAKAVVLPAGIEKLTNLRGINFMNQGKNNIQSLWNALPNLKSLEALQLSFPENITALPNEIRNCKNLKSLSLSIPFLMTLPEWLGELSSLEYLHLSALFNNPSRRALSDIQPILTKLSALKSLQIDNFSIKGTDLMGLNPSTQSLVVNNCRVANSNTFFESINRVPSVEKLSLMNLQIPVLSSEVKLRLPNLKHLTITNLYTDSLRNNHWTGIPDGLVESKRLKFLYLGNVLGESLPKGSENLAELESLNLSNNRLKESLDLGRLTSLKSLVLQSNQLASLPKSIGKLANLETLDVSSNQLTELPEGIFNSLNIKRIQLNNNQLTSLPSSITKLKNLSELNISSNQLKELPNKLGELASLQIFGFGINDISLLPTSIGQLKRLKILGMGHNPLKNLPETLGDCDSLQNLQINNCLLETLPSSIGKLKQLMFLGLTDQDTYYAQSRSTNSQPQPAKYRNQLRALPLSLSQCQKLYNLDLSKNINWDKTFLWPFVQSFRNPGITINLRNCNLDSIPTIGWKDTQIQHFELSGNQIRQLSPEWFIAKGIRGLSLSGNKLVPNTLNNFYNSLEERLLVAEEAGMEVPKPFPDTKEMARAYLSQARQKMNTGDIPKFVAYMKEVERIDVTEGRWATELWGRFYFHSHQYRRAVDSLTVIIDRYFKTIKETDRLAQRGLPIAPMIDFRAQAKWRLGDSLGAIKDYEMMVEDYKLFAPNLWGRLGVWYKLYRPTTGKSGAAFDKAISMYEMVRNQPPMVQMSAAEVYLMSEQADKAYEYIYGLNQDNYKPDEKILAEYLLLCAQIAQKKANESDVTALENKLKKLDFKVKNWSYQLLEDSLSAWSLEKEYVEQLRQLTKAMKAQSVVVD